MRISRVMVNVSHLLCLLLVADSSVLAGPRLLPKLRRTPAVRAQAAPLKPAQLAASLRMPVKLEAGLNLLATATQTPYKSGEIMIPFASQMSISEDRRGAPHLYVPFRWSSKAPRAVTGQWQVVVTPHTYDNTNWEYPAGIVAKGITSDIHKAGQPSYFVIDFGPIFKLPPAFRIEAPVPATHTRTSFRRKGATGMSLNKPLAFGTSAKAVKISPALQLQRTDFVNQVASLSEHRICYVRLVLLDARRQPVGISTYATVRTEVPSTVTLYPGSVPEPQKPANIPAMNILRYQRAIEYGPAAREGRFIVLSNCPQVVKKTMGWKPGQHIHLKPSRDDGTIDQIGDAIDGAVNTIGGLINWASEAWSDIQSAFVSGICGGNDTCKACAGPALKMGLVAVGIPPELPTTSDLCSMGKSYVASYIASQTNVPEELISAGIDRMADVVNNPPDGNGAAYLWPDPQFQDKPAYIDVEVSNDTDETTTPTVLWLLYGSMIGDSSTYPPQIPPWLDTKTPIPPLQPGQTLTFPIFLTRNPEALISHGADSLSIYMDRRVQVRDKGGKVLFFGKTNWWGIEM